MTSSILDGLSLVDSTGRIILATTVGTLLAALAAHVFLRAGYAALEQDLHEGDGPERPFQYQVLSRVMEEAERASGRWRAVNDRAIIADAFRSELRPMLLAERFVRRATSLVIILGVLGTLYGLTLSVGGLVHRPAPDTGAAADVTQVTNGQTEALAGMAVAFSSSLVGIVSAGVLAVLAVVSDVTHRRTALMVKIEAYLRRRHPRAERTPASLQST